MPLMWGAKVGLVLAAASVLAVAGCGGNGSGTDGGAGDSIDSGGEAPGDVLAKGDASQDEDNHVTSDGDADGSPARDAADAPADAHTGALDAGNPIDVQADAHTGALDAGNPIDAQADTPMGCVGAGNAIDAQADAPTGAVDAGNPIDATVPGAINFGVELPLDRPPLLVDPNAQAPAIAFDGTNYLVVWATGFGAPPGFMDILAARVTPAGMVLDLPHMQLNDPDHPGVARGTPAVAFGGNEYLVAWQDSRSGVSQVWGARVSPAGRVLDAAPFSISPPSVKTAFTPAVTFDGSRFLVAWTDVSAGRDVRAAHVTTGGAVVEAAGFALASAGQLREGPAAASTGSGALVL
jgi:hypothetical protein